MRTFLFNFPKLLFFIAFLQMKIVAQTTLAAGDIAFTGYNSVGNIAGVDDKFSFVLTKAVLANTKIKFTDIGWVRTSPTTGSFYPYTTNSGNGDNIIEWTAPALPAGTEVTINNLTASHGTVAFFDGGQPTIGLSFTTAGDEILAFQGTPAAPTFISAILMNVYILAGGDPVTTTAADWDGNFAGNNNSSGLPAGLTTGVNAIWIGTQSDNTSEHDNAKFNGCGLNLSTVTNINNAVNNKINWITSDSPDVMTLPSGCTYLPSVAPSFATHPAASTLCASLSVTFNATTTGGGNTFKWQEATNAGFTTGLVDITATGGVFTLSSSGGNSSTLTISDNTTKNGKFYRCVATNGSGSTSSNGAMLTATANIFPGTGNVSSNATIGTGNASYFFASGCRLIGKVVPGNLTGLVTVESWVEATVPNVASVPFVQRHFQISPTAGTTGTVTLYFSQTDFNNYNAANSSTLDNLPTGPADATGKANFRLTKYNGSSNDFSGLPASYTNGSSIIDPVDSDIVWNATANRWEVTFAVTGFSGFTAQSAVQAPLPVKLVNFTSKINAENQAQLNWKVAEQSDIQAYEIEKSNDAKDFLTIGKVEANKATVTDYKFIDVGPFVGKNYYRLKIFEMNGETNFSKVVSLTFQPEITTNLYPNPSADFLKIDQVGDFVNQSAEILDSRGKLVKSFKLKKDENISIKELSAGIYFIKLACGKSIKFIKN